jgi:glycosyltransferase involved in cell wall biosynthesis
MEKLRILLTNHHYFNFGGTENYTADLAAYLHLLGHDVSIYIHTKHPKMLAFDYFKAKHPFITWYIATPPPNNFDLMLMNHNTTLKALSKYKGYKICTTHGLPGLEKFAPGADAYVCISQELFDFYTGIPDRKLIKTGFVFDKLRYPFKEKLKDTNAILIDYTPTPKSMDYFYKVCKDLGIWAEAFNSKNITPAGMNNIYKNYDIICATGRTALEAAALNKRVVVYSHFGADGFICPKLDKTNFSGRYTNSLQSLEGSLKSAIVATQKDLDVMHKYLKEERSIKHAADQYLKIYYES